jgi:hypothetical protein
LAIGLRNTGGSCDHSPISGFGVRSFFTDLQANEHLAAEKNPDEQEVVRAGSHQALQRHPGVGSGAKSALFEYQNRRSDPLF